MTALKTTGPRGAFLFLALFAGVSILFILRSSFYLPAPQSNYEERARRGGALARQNNYNFAADANRAAASLELAADNSLLNDNALQNYNDATDLKNGEFPSPEDNIGRKHLKKVETASTGQEDPPIQTPHHDEAKKSVKVDDIAPQIRKEDTPDKQSRTVGKGANAAVSDDELERRRQTIRNDLKWAFQTYMDRAMGYDEVRPVTGKAENGWSGQACTLVDALSTLWVAGLREEFDKASDWLIANFTYSDAHGYTSVFETNIRSLGGLISAAELSKKQGLIDKAEDLGSRLSLALSDKGVIKKEINLSQKKVRTNSVCIAETGTIGLEFRQLSKLCANPTFKEKSDKFYDTFIEGNRKSAVNGLYPRFLSNEQFQKSGKFSVGADADSFYEYLLKIWLQSGRKEQWFRDRYDESVAGIKTLIKNTTEGLAFLTSRESSTKLGDTMDHLTCFVPGMLALGAFSHEGSVFDWPTLEVDKEDLDLAEKLAHTCYYFYKSQPSGLSAENYKITAGGLKPQARSYQLRPETIESLYILHQLTGNETYREWGWEIYEAIHSRCRSHYGFATYENVEQVPNLREKTNTRIWGDTQHSFVFAEVFKYAYLLMDPDNEIRLNKHVFNTEAHPFPLEEDLDQSLAVQTG